MIKRDPIEGWLSSKSSPFILILEFMILLIWLSNINWYISSGSIFLLLFDKESKKYQVIKRIQLKIDEYYNYDLPNMLFICLKEKH